MTLKHNNRNELVEVVSSSSSSSAVLHTVHIKRSLYKSCIKHCVNISDS